MAVMWAEPRSQSIPIARQSYRDFIGISLCYPRPGFAWPKRLSASDTSYSWMSWCVSPRGFDADRRATYLIYLNS